MYSYKNNGICHQIGICFTVLQEYIYFCMKNVKKNDNNAKNVKQENSVITNSITNSVNNSNKMCKDDYDEFEIL